MAELTSTHNPNFVLFPVNNNRTAWKPVSQPVMLVVPHRRDLSDIPISNSQVFNVRVYIEDVPREALVAGHDHVGMRFPDKELYAESLSSLELGERIMQINDMTITRDGVAVDPEDAQDGDLITYITSTGITDTIPFIKGANYYDLSDVSIDVELLPSDDYNLVYSCQYFTRKISTDGQEDLLCIDTSSAALAIYRFRIAHPGPVLDEFHRLTPPPYLTNVAKSEDTTLSLYRPLTDTLQDVTDEQDLLESINWVFDTPPEAIPYLSQLLGWELPYFPRSLDQMRRAVLRRTVELQNIKGSRKAIINIFRLFGFEILISNLWWSSDGERLIRPDETLPFPYGDQEITIEERCQVDVLLEDWSSTEFGVFDIPLIRRPQTKSEIDNFAALRDGGPLTVDAYVVEQGSAAQLELQAITDDVKAAPLDYGHQSGCTVDSSGFLEATDIHTRMAGKSVVGYSQILISGKLGQATVESINGEAPITIHGVSLDRDDNTLTLTLTGIVETGYSVYAFATYKKQEFLVPDVLANLQSNRFDLTVVTEDLQEFADPPTLEFAIEFLFKLKAFHSLLNVIRQRIGLNETYEVTDLCVGGDITQRYDMDIGTLQVPPAIIPNVPSEGSCGVDPESLGYKDEDIRLRQRKLINLEEELEAWAAFDSRTTTTGDTRISPNDPASRASMIYNPFGQDRVISGRTNLTDTQHNPSPNSNRSAMGHGSNTDVSPQSNIANNEYNETGPEASSNNDSSAYSSFMREYTDEREPWLELDDRTDYCYKGRVDDEILYRQTLAAAEWHHQNPCSLGLGVGVYYTYPSVTRRVGPGNINRTPGSMSNSVIYTGGASQEAIRHYETDIQVDYLQVGTARLPSKNNSHLGRLYRDYNSPDDNTLHFTNRTRDTDIKNDQRYQLALERPNLQIEKATMHLPGCRFPRLNALESDFTHPTYKARPWDDPYSTFCGPEGVCGENDPTFLNAAMIVDANGNETLSYDDTPFSIIANGLVPDIMSLGDHTLGTGALFDNGDVIHKVYMANAENNPAVTFDQVCDYDTSVDDDSTIEISEPLFQSHNTCASGLLDYADGYPCVSGVQNHPNPTTGYNLDRDGLNQELLNGLGVPTGAPLTYLVMLGSGIRYERGIRLDCGCSLVACESGTNSTSAEIATSICSTDLLYDDEGYLYTDPDRVEVDIRMQIEDTYGTCDKKLDGEIPSLLELA